MQGDESKPWLFKSIISTTYYTSLLWFPCTAWFRSSRRDVALKGWWNWADFGLRRDIRAENSKKGSHFHLSVIQVYSHQGSALPQQNCSLHSCWENYVYTEFPSSFDWLFKYHHICIFLKDDAVFKQQLREQSVVVFEWVRSGTVSCCSAAYFISTEHFSLLGKKNQQENKRELRGKNINDFVMPKQNWQKVRNSRNSNLPQISKPVQAEKLCACLGQSLWTWVFHTVLRTKHLLETTSWSTWVLGAEESRKKFKDDIENLQNQSLENWPHWLSCPAFESHCSRMLQRRSNKACSRQNGIICYRTA